MIKNSKNCKSWNLFQEFQIWNLGNLLERIRCEIFFIIYPISLLSFILLCIPFDPFKVLSYVAIYVSFNFQYDQEFCKLIPKIDKYKKWQQMKCHKSLNEIWVKYYLALNNAIGIVKIKILWSIFAIIFRSVLCISERSKNNCIRNQKLKGNKI